MQYYKFTGLLENMSLQEIFPQELNRDATCDFLSIFPEKRNLSLWSCAKIIRLMSFFQTTYLYKLISNKLKYTKYEYRTRLTYMHLCHILQLTILQQPGEIEEVRKLLTINVKQNFICKIRSHFCLFCETHTTLNLFSFQRSIFTV